MPMRCFAARLLHHSSLQLFFFLHQVRVRVRVRVSVHKITQYFLLCGFPCISIAVVLFCSPVEVPLEDLGMPLSEEFFAFLHCASPRYPWGARVSQELDDHTAKALAPVTQGRV